MVRSASPAPPAAVSPAHRLLGLLASGLIVATVVAMDPGGWSIFGPSKWWATTTLGFAAIAVMLGAGRVVLATRTTALFGALVGWLAVASFFAADPFSAVLGTPDRHLGLVAWVLFGGLFVAGQQLSVPSATARFGRAVSIAGLGVGLYALVELVAGPPVDLSLTTDRLGGTFGQPAFLGAAVVLLLPVAVAQAAERQATIWRVLGGAAAVLLIVAGLGAQTRGAWIGLLVAGAAVAAANLGWLRQRPAVPAAILVGLVLVALVTPVGGRVVDGFDFGDGTSRGRIDEWQVATSAIGGSPILGHGLEGYRVVFGEYVDAEYEQRYGRTVQPDRAHNTLLDIGVAGGLPALGLWAALLLFVGRAGWRSVRLGSAIEVGIGAAVLGYIAQQMFLFPLSELDPVFWVLAGVVAAQEAPDELQSVSVDRWWQLPVATLAAVAVVAGALDVAADRRFGDALATRASDPVGALESADSAVRLRPDSLRYHLGASLTATTTLDLAGIERALDRVEAGLARSDRDPALRRQEALLYLERARLTNDETHRSIAAVAWRDLATTDPNNAAIQDRLGLALLAVNDIEGARMAWAAAAELAPLDPEPLLALARLELGRGDRKAAAVYVDAALLRAPEDPDALDLAETLAGS